MGLDISQIKNAELKKLAYQVDKDNNSTLNVEEFSVFKNEAAKQEGISAEDFNQAMGLYTTVPISGTEAPRTNSISKKDEKTYKNSVKEYIKNLAKSKQVAPQDLVTVLKEQFKNSDYSGVIAEVETVTNAVIATTCNSKQDVEDIKKKVKKAKNQTNLTDFQKDILDQVIKMVETEQIAKEANTLIEMYKREKAKIKGTPNFTTLENNVKTEMKKSGIDKTSYYPDEAFDKLKEYIKGDSKMVHTENLKHTTGESYKEVKSELKEKAADGDKYAKNDIKADKRTEKTAARHNRYEENYKTLEKIDAETLKDELGKDLYEKLNRSFLAEHKNADGTFDVREIADKLLYRVGLDYVLNQSKDTEATEMKNAQVELKALTGQDFSKSEIKKLCKLSTIDVEKNDRKKALITALPFGAIPSAISALASSSKLHVSQTVNITLSAKEASQILKDLKAQGIAPDVVELAGDKVGIRVHQEVLRDHRALNALMGAGIGALGAVALALIFGEGKQFEKSCISISDFDFSNPRYTNFEEYENYVKSRYPEGKANGIILIAKMCQDENGKFDPEKFDSMMKHIGGVGSNVNCDELKAGTLYADKNDGKKDKKVCKTGEDDCNAIVTKETTEATETKEDLTKIHTRKGGDTWKGLVEAYYPDLVAKCGGLYGKNGAIRALKVALANGDKDILRKLLEDGDIPKTIKLPSSINGVNRVDGTVVAGDVEGDGHSRLKEVGKDEIKVTKIPGTTTYKAVDGCDEKQAPAYGSSKDEAVKNLKRLTRKEYKKIIEQY